MKTSKNSKLENTVEVGCEKKRQGWLWIKAKWQMTNLCEGLRERRIEVKWYVALDKILWVRRRK